MAAVLLLFVLFDPFNVLNTIYLIMAKSSSLTLFSFLYKEFVYDKLVCFTQITNNASSQRFTKIGPSIKLYNRGQKMLYSIYCRFKKKM